MNKNNILEVQGLKVTFHSKGKEIQAVRGVSLTVGEGEIVGLVGESGSGKSVTMKAVLGILPENAIVKSEHLRLNGEELSSLKKADYREKRGKEMTMIFQDPMTALNPVTKIGTQMTEVILRHNQCSKAEARQRAIEMLEKVGIPGPKERMGQYPHEFSGGMRQRVLIAMALSCEPKLLIADEPTTALDVTIQAQILDILQELKEEYHTSIVLITHDMGVVASVCSKIAIMYGGLIMETGTADEIFYEPRHPYTKALLKAVPTLDLKEGERLKAIPGMPPSLVEPPKGCPFAERCTEVQEICRQHLPQIKRFGDTHCVMCHLCKEEGGKQP